MSSDNATVILEHDNSYYVLQCNAFENLYNREVFENVVENPAVSKFTDVEFAWTFANTLEELDNTEYGVVKICI